MPFTTRFSSLVVMYVSGFTFIEATSSGPAISWDSNMSKVQRELRRTWQNVHCPTHDSKKQTHGLLLVLLVVFGAAQTSRATDTGLPNPDRALQIGNSIGVYSCRNGKSWQEERLDHELEERLSQRRPDI